MDASKKSRIPTRAYEKYYHEKENVVMEKTAQNPNANLNVSSRRHRILSDTALLPPRKKVKIAVARLKVEPVTRPPLGDLDKNIANKNLPVCDAEVKKKVHSVKTVSFKNADTGTIQYEKKIEKLSEKITKTKYEYERNIYRSQLTQLPTNYKVHQPTSTVNLQKTSSNEPTTSNHNLAKEAVDLNQGFIKVDKAKITVRQQFTPYPRKLASKDDSYIDEIFVDASQHYAFKKSGQNCGKRSIRLTDHNGNGYISPIKPHRCINKSTVLIQGIPDEVRRPARKTTLSHKTQSRSRPRNSTAYCLDIYNTEYLDDIVGYQLRNDWKYVLNLNLLKLCNPCAKQSRLAVVNWLIKAQEYLNLSPTVLFATIRLFDRVLETMPIPCNMCQLVGLVIMWILSKFDDAVNIVTTSKMLSLCGGVYSNLDFLKMEQKLLAVFNFDLHIPDVTLYVAFYIKKLRTDQDLLLHCAFYILECYTLNVKFSTVIPSMQAASAVCLALKILSPSKLLWQQLNNAIAYYPEEELDNIIKEMLQQLHVIQDPAYEYREPYKKYTEKDKAQVSLVLLRKLVAT